MMRWFLGLLLSCSGLVCFSEVAYAGSFDVSPVSVTLSDKESSATLKLTNHADEAVRFHVTAFAWDQKSSGEMVLNPTSDVVFFPAMLTLRPNEARNLRVGVQAKPGAAEKTYRIFVQELPPTVTPENPGVVRVLMKVGIPIFLEPRSAVAKPLLADLAVQDKTLTFNVKNAGNKHLRLQKLVIKALSGGKLVYSRELDPWYVLAGGTRTYSVEIPADACKSQNSMQIELQSDHGAANASLANAHCAP